MNVKEVIKQLKKEYPSRRIIKNSNTNPTEIICEISPTEENPDYSIAIAVIDQSIPHYHKKTTETYEVLRGKLILKIRGKETLLKTGDKVTVRPNTIHSAKGKETWIKVYSKPGWLFRDHILVEKNKF